VSRLGEAIDGRMGEVNFRSKNDFASVAGVTGVPGPLLSTEEVSLPVLVRKLRSMVEKSESLPDEIDPAEEPEMLRISGAVNAWTLVVEISSVGREMRLRSMVPGAYLTVVLRGIVVCSVLRLTRLVNAREIDIVEEDSMMRTVNREKACSKYGRDEEFAEVCVSRQYRKG